MAKKVETVFGRELLMIVVSLLVGYILAKNMGWDISWGIIGGVALGFLLIRGWV